MNEITDYWGGWLAGFTDGEGCFRIAKQDEVNPCACYGCRFKINLRDDDKAILQEIQDTLGIGRIYDGLASTNAGLNHQALACFQVSAIADCAEIVKIFEKYPLRAKKQRDFEIWKQAVAELQKPIGCRNSDMLEYYFCKIKEVRQYNVQEELSKPKIKEIQLIIKF